MAQAELIITDTDGIVAAFRSLDSRASRRVLRGAGRTAANTLLKAAKGLARERIKGRGILRRQLRLSENRREVGGWRVVFGDNWIAPHATLVEYGHKIILGGKVVGESPAQNVLRDAADATHSQVSHLMVFDLRRRVDLEVQKAKASRR